MSCRLMSSPSRCYVVGGWKNLIDMIRPSPFSDTKSLICDRWLDAIWCKIYILVSIHSLVSLHCLLLFFFNYYCTTLCSVQVQAAHLAHLIKINRQTKLRFASVPCSGLVCLPPTPTPPPHCLALQVSLEGDSSFWRPSNLNTLLLWWNQGSENPLGCIKSRDLTSNWECQKKHSAT